MFLVAGLVWYAFNKGYLGVPSLRVPNFNAPKINVQRDSHIETPKDINSNISFDNPNHTSLEPPPIGAPKAPKPRTTKINEDILAFSNGTELLVEPDTD